MIRKLDTEFHIRHSEVTIGTSMLMISEASTTYPAQHTSLYVYVKDTDQTFYNAIDAGATALMLPMDEDYGARGAGFRDTFGNTWWIATL